MEDWLPEHDLQGVKTPFGLIGSAGDARLRELARNARVIPERFHHKVEKKRGGEIGLDPRFKYFRYRPQAKAISREEAVRIGQENCRMFEAA